MSDLWIIYASTQHPEQVTADLLIFFVLFLISEWNCKRHRLPLQLQPQLNFNLHFETGPPFGVRLMTGGSLKYECNTHSHSGHANFQRFKSHNLYYKRKTLRLIGSRPDKLAQTRPQLETQSAALCSSWDRKNKRQLFIQNETMWRFLAKLFRILSLPPPPLSLSLSLSPRIMSLLSCLLPPYDITYRIFLESYPSISFPYLFRIQLRQPLRRKRI